MAPFTKGQNFYLYFHDFFISLKLRNATNGQATLNYIPIYIYIHKYIYGLIVTNTCFKKPKRRLYTWKAPGDWGRHQLNYMLIKHRFRNSVKDVQTLPGADIDSDHNLLVAKVCPRLKKITRFQSSRPRWDLEKLYAQRQSVQDTLEEKLGELYVNVGMRKCSGKI